MKKVLLTAALGCTMLTPVFAAGGDNTVTGGFPFLVQDYIELLPHGAFPPDEIAVQFINPQQMTDGIDIPTGEFTVVANRSWKVMYSATDFTRQEDPEPHISQTLPVDQIFQVKATTTDPLVSGTPLHTVHNGPVGDLLASGQGGPSRKYTIGGKITPGNIFATHNVSGSYVSDVMQVASLD